MATIDPKSLSTDYKKLLSVPVGDRAKLVRSGVVDSIMSALTPSQQAALFPNYYLQTLPDVGAVGGTSLYGALSGAPGTSGGGGTGTPTLSIEKPKTPEEKAIAEIYRESKLDVKGLPADSPIPPTYSPEEGMPTKFNRVTGDPNSPEMRAQITGVETPYGKINVNKDAAMAFSGFYNDLYELGFPMSNAPGSYNVRQKRSAGAGHNPGSGWSQHSYGNATDIGNQTQWNKEQLEWLEKNPGALEKVKSKWGMVSPKNDEPHMEFVGKISVEARDQITQKQLAQIEAEKAKNAGQGEVTASQVAFDPASLDKLNPKLRTYYDNASSVEKQKFEKAVSILGVSRIDEIMQKHSSPDQIAKTTNDVVAKQGASEVKAGDEKVSEQKSEPKEAAPVIENTQINQTNVTNIQNQQPESTSSSRSSEVGRMSAEEYRKLNTNELTAKELQVLNANVSPSVISNSQPTATAMAIGGLKDIPPGEDKVIADAKTGNVENYINSRESVQLKVDPATLNKRDPQPVFADTEKMNTENPTIEAAKAVPQREVAKIPNLLTDVAGSVYPYSPSFERALSRSNEMTRNHFGDPHMIRGA